VIRRIKVAVFVTTGLLVATGLAFFAGPLASDAPDGLNRVAIDEGFADRESAHALEDVPTAGYSVRGVGDRGLSTGLAGLLGVAVTFAAAACLCFVVSRALRRRATSS
jgi:hypothetical protein